MGWRNPESYCTAQFTSIMHVCIIQLNGWSDTFNERIEVLSQHVGHILLIRPCPKHNKSQLEQRPGIDVYNVYPKRDTTLPVWLHPIILPLHALQAVFLLFILIGFSKRRPDVIHSLDYVVGGFVGAVVTSVSSIPLVVSVRGMQVENYEANIADDLALVALCNFHIIKITQRLVLQRVDYVITKSEYQTNYVNSIVPENVPTITVPTGVDFDKFDPDSVEETLSTTIPWVDSSKWGDQPIFLHLGRLTKTKGTDLILSHISNLDPALNDSVQFVFVGEVPNTEFEDIIFTMRENIDEDIVIYPNRVPFDQVPGLIKTSEAIILLSQPKVEGTPRILQEAVAMEKPFIASDVEGVAEPFIDKKGCYLVERGDQDDFEEAIDSILSESPAINRERFRDKFDIHKNYEKYRGVYESLSSKSTE